MTTNDKPRLFVPGDRVVNTESGETGEVVRHRMVARAYVWVTVRLDTGGLRARPLSEWRKAEEKT